MASIIYWGIFLAVAVIIFRNRLIAGDRCAAGYEKVNGKWEQTMMPDHYTGDMVVFFYMGAAILIIFGIWLASAWLLHISSIDSVLGIKTGLPTIIERWPVLIHK